MVHGWSCLLLCMGLNVMPLSINVCLCVSELQRTSILGSYRCEPWSGLASHACDQLGMRELSIGQRGCFNMDAAVVSRLREFGLGEGATLCQVDGEQRSAKSHVSAVRARRWL